MFNSVSRFIGLRYTGARNTSPGNTSANSNGRLVSFISGISIAGLSLGVGLLLTVLSVMNGFEREVREKILGVMPHGAIYHRYGVAQWPTLAQQIEQHPNIIATAPFVELQGMLGKSARVEPAAIYGIDPQREAGVSQLHQYLAPEALQHFATAPEGILLGESLAAQLNASVGDRIRLIIPSQSGAHTAPKFQSMQLNGLIKTNTELDHALAIVHLQAAQKLSPHPENISGVRIKAEDLYQVPQNLYDIITTLEYGHYASDWTRTHGNLFHAIQMSKNLIGLLLFMIVAIAAFNVVSTLVMVVVDKQADIAILKTLGASRRDILSIFMVQGSLIGVIGTTLGVLLGVAGSLSAQHAVEWIESLFEVQFLNSEVYPINYIPAEMWLSDFIWVTLASLLLGFLSTLYPAWMAAKVEPSEALRYEL